MPSTRAARAAANIDETETETTAAGSKNGKPGSVSNTAGNTSNAAAGSKTEIANDDPDRPAEDSAAPNALLARLGTTLQPDLMVQALTHRSFSHEHENAPNYERLEFLGDAVLEFVSTETLYRVHPDMSEGQLAKMRAAAVSEDALSKVAREKLQVGPYILLGHGEDDDHGAEKSSILCDIVESLIGATFVEHGIDEARKVVHGLIDDTLAEVATEGPALDWKTSLTVKAHGLGLGEPHYRMAVGGPEYAPEFTAEAMLDGSDEVLGTATGSSKRKAQLKAAELAWKELDENPGEHQRHRHHSN